MANACDNTVMSSFTAINKNPYTILQVARTASNAEIKKAYYRLAQHCHPDHNPGDPNATANFQALGNAYDILKDKTKRPLLDASLPSSDFKQTSRRDPPKGSARQAKHSDRDAASESEWKPKSDTEHHQASNFEQYSRYSADPRSRQDDRKRSSKLEKRYDRDAASGSESEWKPKSDTEHDQASSSEQYSKFSAQGKPQYGRRKQSRMQDELFGRDVASASESEGERTSDTEYNKPTAPKPYTKYNANLRYTDARYYRDFSKHYSAFNSGNKSQASSEPISEAMPNEKPWAKKEQVPLGMTKSERLGKPFKLDMEELFKEQEDSEICGAFDRLHI